MAALILLTTSALVADGYSSSSFSATSTRLLVVTELYYHLESLGGTLAAHAAVTSQPSTTSCVSMTFS